MNCRFCGTALPAGALFCGECGRAVAVGTATPAAVAAGADIPADATPMVAELAFSSERDAEPRPPAPVESLFLCPQCGEPISDDDVFCGECGFVLTTTPPPAVRDTVALEPALESESAPEPEPESAGESESAPESEPGPDEVLFVAPALVEPGRSSVPIPVGATAPIDEADVESEPEPDDGGPRRPVPSISMPKKSLRKVPDPFPWGQTPTASPRGAQGGRVDLEATRITAPTSVEERFVLQFSTGESVTVSGAGLVGRNPSSQPGEFVDQLVTIFDAGKSVSKTHLEFGQDSGRFWVSDRYSTNGSSVRQPDADPKRCEPGRRYFVARGTRVDIGDQFFVVS